MRLSPRPTPFEDEFRQQLPDVQLEDELFEQAGRNVMNGGPIVGQFRAWPKLSRVWSS